MDVINFLLKNTVRLVLALSGLAVTVAVALINALTGALARQAQRNSGAQEPPASLSTVPVSHRREAPRAEVLAPVPAPAPAVPSAPQTAQAMPARPAQGTPAAILGQPDHAIYITTGSHLMMRHPDSDRLLDALDDMLLVAAHRNGQPFVVAPALDGSEAASPVQLPPLADYDATVFEDTAPRPMPLADGAVWLRRAGTDAIPLAASGAR